MDASIQLKVLYLSLIFFMSSTLEIYETNSWVCILTYLFSCQHHAHSRTTIPKSLWMKETIAINIIALKVYGNSSYDSYIINAVWYDESVKMSNPMYKQYCALKVVSSWNACLCFGTWLSWAHTFLFLACVIPSNMFKVKFLIMFCSEKVLIAIKTKDCSAGWNICVT